MGGFGSGRHGGGRFTDDMRALDVRKIRWVLSGRRQNTVLHEEGALNPKEKGLGITEALVILALRMTCVGALQPRERQAPRASGRKSLAQE